MPARQFADDTDLRFKIFHELMQSKVRDILLVSTLYDACIIDEDGRLAERIIYEYRGLNLSQPPRLTWVSSASEALAVLDNKKIDLVITMLRLADTDAYALGRELKKKAPNLPVVLLSHSAPDPRCVIESPPRHDIDRSFVWTGNTELLIALVKSAEDVMNVARDTQLAGVRVILFVEDSPLYLSSLLPILYREVILQTQAVMEEALNEEHKLLTMRARPKILVAESFEEAENLYKRFEPYILGIISDVRVPRNCQLDPDAGISFLTNVKVERPDIPLLLTSSELSNAPRAAEIPAKFLNKNSPGLHAELRSFLVRHLGFGDFVFRTPDGREIARVSNMRSLEKILPSIPAESFYFHWSRNDFSRWLFARTEVILASKLRPATDNDFSGDVESMREFIISNVRNRRLRRQKGIVVSLDASDFDPDTDFLKIGKGSLGGKARGLIFISNMLHRNPVLQDKFPEVKFFFPQTLVVTTEGFDSFLEINEMRGMSKTNAPDERVADAFIKAKFPRWIEKKLKVFLSHAKYPLAVRSSSLLEDSRFRPYAGLYRTYMLPNNHPELETRLSQLITAIKLVYASTYFKSPRSFAQRSPHRTEEEKMAIIIQRLVGKQYGSHFYPAISGVAQSHNYYPLSHMRMDEGVGHVALGLGKIVMEGGRVLRFSPKYPQVLPQFATVADTLKNSQRFFYSLNMENPSLAVDLNEDSTLERREVSAADQDGPLGMLASTYLPEEERISDDAIMAGHRILTFSQVLKYGLFPLPEILSEILDMGRQGMGCPVEIEFSINIAQDPKLEPQFAFLQIRPMADERQMMGVKITDKDIAEAFCFSSHALGNGRKNDLRDILYVKPDSFDVSRTPEIVREIDGLNSILAKENRKYLLIGPGRWGSADRWLGIPVNWSDISGVGAIVETTVPELSVEPSQGTHFFHNITTLGIDYVMVASDGEDFLDWNWLASRPIAHETAHLAHVQLTAPFLSKVDGSTMRCVMLPPGKGNGEQQRD